MRAVSRALLVTLDAVEHDWQVSGAIWHVAAVWLNSDPVKIAEFLRLFDLHQAAKHRECSSQTVLVEENQ